MDTRPRRVPLLAVLLLAACGGPAATVDPAPAPPPPPDPAAEARAAGLAPTGFPEVSFAGQTFRFGDRVRLARRAGTFKPEDTGYRHEVVAGPGQAGTVLGGEPRKPTSYFTPPPGEPIQIVRVRWDRQMWSTQAAYGQPPPDTTTAVLEPFEATVHITYLEPEG